MDSDETIDVVWFSLFYEAGRQHYINGIWEPPKTRDFKLSYEMGWQDAEGDTKLEMQGW